MELSDNTVKKLFTIKEILRTKLIYTISKLKILHIYVHREKKKITKLEIRMKEKREAVSYDCMETDLYFKKSLH